MKFLLVFIMPWIVFLFTGIYIGYGIAKQSYIQYVARDVDAGTTAILIGGPGIPSGDVVYTCNDTIIVASHPLHSNPGFYEIITPIP